MDKKTAKALKGSIRKWEKIVEGKGIDKGSANCPLCKEFYYCGSCLGCPVEIEVNNFHCVGTPYFMWAIHLNTEHTGLLKKIHCPTCKTLAKAELKFLKSLREK